MNGKNLPPQPPLRLSECDAQDLVWTGIDPAVTADEEADEGKRNIAVRGRCWCLFRCQSGNSEACHLIRDPSLMQLVTRST
jgi:hypothetical protein